MEQFDFLLIIALAASVVAFLLILFAIIGRRKDKKKRKTGETGREGKRETPGGETNGGIKKEETWSEWEEDSSPDPRLYVIFQEEDAPPPSRESAKLALMGSLAGGMSGGEKWICQICEAENSSAVTNCQVCGEGRIL